MSFFLNLHNVCRTKHGSFHVEFMFRPFAIYGLISVTASNKCHGEDPYKIKNYWWDTGTPVTHGP